MKYVEKLLFIFYISEGCTTALKLWTDPETNITYLIDGHNRLNICKEHNIPYQVEYKQFNNRYEVIDWMISNQAGRRNLVEKEMDYLMGLKYQNEKNNITNPNGMNQHTKNEVGGNSCHQPNKEPQFQSVKTAEKIAEEFGVAERTVRDNAHYANAVDTIAKTVGIEAKNNILKQNKQVSKKDVITIGKQIEEGIANIDDLKEKLLCRNQQSQI